MNTLQYNQYRVPCNWSFAQEHGKASQTKKKQIQKNSKNCKCCNQPIEKQTISLNTQYIDLGFLGPGFPLFYNFIIFCLLLLLAKACTQSMLNLYIYYNGNFCNQKWYNIKHKTQLGYQSCPKRLWNKIAQPNSLNLIHENQNSFEKQLMSIMYICRSLFFFSSIFLIYSFNLEQRRIYNHVDLLNISASDFAVHISKIPTNAHIPKLIEYLVIYIGINAQQIYQIFPIYNFQKFYEIKKKLSQNRQYRAKLLTQKKQQQYFQNDKKFQQLCHQYNQELDLLNQDHKEKRIGQAIVVVTNQQIKHQLLKFHNTLIQFQIKDQKEKITYLSFKPFIKQAPQPSDLNWQQIFVSEEQRRCNIIIAYFYTVGVLFVCFVVIFSILVLKSYLYDSVLQEQIQERSQLNQHFFNQQQQIQEQIQSNAKLYFASILVWLITLLIFFFNKFVLGNIIHNIVDTQKLQTYSDIQVHFARKYTWSLFFTTALMTLAVQGIVYNNIYQEKGIVQMQSVMFLINSVLPPLIWFINPWYLLKLYHRKKKFKNPNIKLTQMQAHELMQNPPYFMGKRYSDLMKTMWFTFLFARLIPVGVILSFFGVLVYYWVDKYNLLRKFCVKQNIGKKVAFKMSNFLEFIILWSQLGNLFFKYKMNVQIYAFDWIMFASAFLVVIIPIEWVITLFFGNPSLTVQSLNIKQAKKHFQQYYTEFYPLNLPKLLKTGQKSQIRKKELN